MARRKEFPAMHVYHFGGYEPGAFKHLMGLYATREEEIDSMLRAGLFVDLHAVFKQALRAGVEEYSLKTLEHFAGFKRNIHKDDSRAAMRYITHSLELGWAEAIPEKFITAMETYNRDDCFATSALRDWLESQRTAQIAAGHKIDRPPLGDGAPTEELNARQQRVKALVKKLTADIPVDAANATKNNPQPGFSPNSSTFIAAKTKPPIGKAIGWPSWMTTIYSTIAPV